MATVDIDKKDFESVRDNQLVSATPTIKIFRKVYQELQFEKFFSAVRFQSP